jgi:hypothetical protein
MQEHLPKVRPLLIGGGNLDYPQAGLLRLTIPPVTRGYADAQIDDHRHLPRRRFPWYPPLRLSLRARASRPAPLGTLGFGFWNDPFSLSLGQAGAARRLPASPHALWFFHGSPPHDLAFSDHLPGYGWKAMSLRSPKIPGPILAIPAAAAVLLSQIPGVRRPILRTALRSVRAAEAVLAVALNEWHTYSLEWFPCEAAFRVDGEMVLSAPNPPPPPLGFVAWIDNQYAVASPLKGFRFGALPTPHPQWLEIADLEIQAL